MIKRPIIQVWHNIKEMQSLWHNIEIKAPDLKCNSTIALFMQLDYRQ